MRTWADVYQNQARESMNALSTIDKDRVEFFINMIKETDGVVFFTGVGKNGHVAAKTSSTYSSMNIRSFFIDPVEGLHGAMSTIRENDIVVAVSKSANTVELYYFLKNLKLKTPNTQIVLFHSNSFGKCIEVSDVDIEVKIRNENDKFNIIPINSITIFTILLQSIGVELSYHNGLTREQFLSNHPGGSIGGVKI